MSLLQLPIISIFILVILPAKCSDLGRDGFNIYKDYLRARPEENLEETPLPDRMLYFYRTPIQLSSGFISNTEDEYRERTGNAFKNHMLNKELLESEMPNKRALKTVVTFMLPTRQPYHQDVIHPENEMDLPDSEH